MKTVHIVSSLASLTVLGACRSEPDKLVFTIQADRFDGAEWSDPVNLGPLINSSALDANASLSSDEHTIYFASTRAGGFGQQDLWTSRRQCLQCPFDAPVNMGPLFNTAAAEAAPSVSEDGQLLFFFSARPGGFGAQTSTCHIASARARTATSGANR